MRTRTPEQAEAEYNWLSPALVAPMIGVDSEDQVRTLIRSGELDAIDVSRSSKPRYKVSPEAVKKFNRESADRVKKAG